MGKGKSKAKQPARQTGKQRRGGTTQPPLPAWAVDILLSPDIAPCIFQALAVRDCAAAAVCQAWARQWEEKIRRVPRLVPGKPLVPVVPMGTRAGLQELDSRGRPRMRVADCGIARLPLCTFAPSRSEEYSAGGTQEYGAAAKV